MIKKLGKKRLATFYCRVRNFSNSYTARKIVEPHALTDVAPLPSGLRLSGGDGIPPERHSSTTLRMWRSVARVKSFRLFLALPLLFSLFVSASLAQEVKIPTRGQGYVSDFAGLLKPADKLAITKFASELEKKTTAQLAVVTIQSTQPETIQGFSVRLFDQWKIGQKGKDNGVLILIAVNDRKAWITTGYGLEGAIPDVIANKIVQASMIPYFKSGQYSQGIKEGSVAVISLIAKEYDVQITGQEAQVYQTVHRKTSPLQILFTILMFIFIIGSRTGFLGYFLMGSLIGGRRRGGYWHGTGFGGAGGGFSGGFGGFGGGMTGGGGGGGGW